MATKTYKCPNCGAALKFDASDGTVDCDYCNSEFSVAEVEAFNQELLDNSPADAGEFHSYNCANCGAEVVTDASTSASFCYYCHQPVILTDRVSGKFKPDYILPFRFDQKQAQEKFLNWVKGRRFVPQDFTSSSQLEKMSGLYLPVWLASVDNQIYFHGEGLKHQILGSRKEAVESYEIERSGQMSLMNMLEPAFKQDDKISPAVFESISSYDWQDKQEFAAAYLSGYLAELWTVGPEEAGAQAESKAVGYVRNMVNNELHQNYDQLNLNKSKIEPQLKNISYVLAPAWILTYIYQDKVYIYAMNGQTAEIYGELPIDKKRVGLSALLLALLILILLLLGGRFIW